MKNNDEKFEAIKKYLLLNINKFKKEINELENNSDNTDKDIKEIVKNVLLYLMDEIEDDINDSEFGRKSQFLYKFYNYTNKEISQCLIDDLDNIMHRCGHY